MSGRAAAAGGGTDMHGFEPTLLGLIVLLPLVGFLVNGAAAFLAPNQKAIPTWVGPSVVGAAFLIALVNFFGMLGADLHDPIVRTYWSWMPVGELEVDAALQLDQLSLLMTLVVTGVGFLIHVFSVGYMREDPGYARYFAYLNLFVFFMLTLVLGANFPLMFVGWEGVGLCSYLLIGFWFRDPAPASAAKRRVRSVHCQFQTGDSSVQRPANAMLSALWSLRT